ncbi:MAG: hypothetical protein NXI10_16280 [bacterium]|nr:hypothetical protein [bacterium]
MKLGKLLIVASLLIGSTAFAQEGEGEDRECTRLRVVANNAMGVENWKEAVEYFIRAEEYCAEFGKDNYDRLLASTQNMMAAQEDKSDAYYAYLDTLMMVWDKAEEAGHYDINDDISRGYHYTLLKAPNYKKADFYMGRAIKARGTELSDEVYLLLYYYNIYSLWFVEQDAEAKEELKQRFINEYFMLTKLIKEANYSLSTQETLTGYLSQLITSCEDLLPAVPKYMESLPEAPEDKKTALMNFAQLLIDQECKDSEEFAMMVETLYEIDPEDLEIQLLYLETLSCSEKIPVYKDIKEKTFDAEKKNEIQYNIAACYMQIGSYNNAYAAAKSVTGSLKGKALQIQAGCVAATANSCGDSTFERKCNYIYAAELMEQAGLDGSKYRNMGPSTEDCFNNNSPKSVTLTCWGVTVNPCP